MLAMTPPVDLHREFSRTLPTLMICGLLGDLFDEARSRAAMSEFSAYIRDLVGVKRKSPGADIISDLIAASDEYRIAESEIVKYCIDLLFADHETTVTRIDFGTAQ
jgi:cytochrome P450